MSVTQFSNACKHNTYFSLRECAVAIKYHRNALCPSNCTIFSKYVTHSLKRPAAVYASNANLQMSSFFRLEWNANTYNSNAANLIDVFLQDPKQQNGFFERCLRNLNGIMVVRCVNGIVHGRMNHVNQKRSESL